MQAVEERRYGLRRKVSMSFDEANNRVRQTLKDQGFGVLTEIDVKSTLEQKLGVQGEPYLILGACNPNLAHQALSEDPEVGLLLPCNVVVRQAGADVLVEALDPAAAMGIVGNEAIEGVAGEARERLQKALAAL
ncbi:MAG: DUF302 domain-containing protein [Dehalococcoidia bacterium]|nr:DUF302 domain-containing protein [Dehalococcoidia bacterium]